MDPSPEFCCLVCAIDLGTTLSGYAYADKRDYQYDPLNITVPNWIDPSSFTITKKTPTTLLLDKDRRFVAFGYEAKTTYDELEKKGKNVEYIFIPQFDFMFQDTLEMDMKIRDSTGTREILAIKVLTHAIKYFRKLMLNTINRKRLDVKETNIKWVLTFPAIWPDRVKQLMIEAAELAGIPKIKLTMAFESEVASIYCSRLPISGFVDRDNFGIHQIGQKFLVLDAADSTVDITVHEVANSRTLKVLEKARVLDCGDFCVDNYFKDILTDVVTSDVIEAFRLNHTNEYNNFMQEFQNKKRTTNTTKQTWVSMRMPESLPKVFEKLKNKSFKEELTDSKYCKSIKWDGDYLCISPALFEHFFVSARTSISDYVWDMLENPHMDGTDTIIMIGGFSGTPILQTYMKNRFSACRIVIPNDPELAVLKGGVLFGYNSYMMSERKAKYWYGIASVTKFNPKFHDNEKKNKDLCCDIFDICVQRGSILTVYEGHFKGPYETNRDDQNEMDLEIYVSDSDTPPMYVTDEKCHYLGSLTVDLPKNSKRNTRGVFVNFTFGGKEFFVRARINSNKVVMTGTFNFLENEP
ncbi:heat shock 70 kDa protein 12A-like [Crassostrea virginica]